MSVAPDVGKHVFVCQVERPVGWKWPALGVRSLGIHEALKCLVSGEGGLAAVAQTGRLLTEGEGHINTAQNGAIRHRASDIHGGRLIVAVHAANTTSD